MQGLKVTKEGAGTRHSQSPSMNFIVIGGAGALGKAVVSSISSRTNASNTNIISIDHKPNAQTTFDINTSMIPTSEICGHVFNKLKQMRIEMVDVIVNVAGGVDRRGCKFRVYHRVYYIVVLALIVDSERMWNQSVQSSMLAVHLAAKLFDPSKSSTK